MVKSLIDLPVIVVEMIHVLKFQRHVYLEIHDRHLRVLIIRINERYLIWHKRS